VDGASGSAAAPGAGIRNILPNADFNANPSVTTTAVDAAAINSPWYALNQTANTTAALQTLQADGIPDNIRLTQSNAGAQRHGVAQIVKSDDSVRLRGSSATLSAKIRHSLAAPIRYAVLSWAGTADAVTRDVVNDWTSTNYTPSNFFIANVAVVAVGSITPTANAWTSVSAISGAVSSSANNLVVFFWTQDSTALNATLDVAQVQIEQGTTATSFEFLPKRLNLLEPPGWDLLTSSTFSAPLFEVNWTEDVYSAFRVTILLRAASDTTDLYMRFKRGGVFIFGGTDYRNTFGWFANSLTASTANSISYFQLTAGGLQAQPAVIEQTIVQNLSTDNPVGSGRTRWLETATPAHAVGTFSTMCIAGSGWLGGIQISTTGGVTNLAGRITVLGLKR
jgi:hypothetical protein